MTQVPGIPLAALDAVQDENTRIVLQAMADAWHVRNGSTGDGGGAFITRAELTKVTGDSPALGYKGEWRNLIQAIGGASAATPGTSQLNPGVTQAQLDAVADRVSIVEGAQTALTNTIASVWTDPMFTGLATSVTALGQADLAIGQRITSEVATLNDTIITKVGVVNTRVTNEVSALNGTIAIKSTEINTRVDGEVTTINGTITSRVSQLTGYIDGNVNTLNGRITNEVTAINGVISGQALSLGNLISTESTNRFNADQAIYTEIDTRISVVNGSIAGIRTTAETAATNVAALSGTVTTLSATVGGHTTAISQEAEARANADGVLQSRWAVKVDANGYISGFGLMSEANDATPHSSFIVRADKFAIASPAGPGVAPASPFIVTTTTDERGNPPGVYLTTAVADQIVVKKLYGATGTFSGALNAATGTYSGSLTAFAIDAVDTINLKNDAVTVPVYISDTTSLSGSQVIYSGTTYVQEYTLCTVSTDPNGRGVVLIWMDGGSATNTISGTVSTGPHAYIDSYLIRKVGTVETVIMEARSADADNTFPGITPRGISFSVLSDDIGPGVTATYFYRLTASTTVSSSSGFSPVWNYGRAAFRAIFMDGKK